ncbi:hypothetical protein AHiyo8_15990 [Arthrobacter sp. Hiyo8]|nr:hypothetical protein AHiyo8_15990 [Arthrobacter sp. Hiyo8]
MLFEPDAHGCLAAGNDGPCQSPQIELVDIRAEATTGSVDDLSGAVVPGFQFGTHQGTVVVGEAEEFGHGGNRHRVSQRREGGPGGIEDGFVRRAQSELFQGMVQEAFGHGRQGCFEAGEVVEEGAPGYAGFFRDVFHGEIAGPLAAQHGEGRVGDRLAGGQFVLFAARREGDSVGRRHIVTLSATLHSGQVKSPVGSRVPGARPTSRPAWIAGWAVGLPRW